MGRIGWVIAQRKSLRYKAKFLCALVEKRDSVSISEPPLLRHVSPSVLFYRLAGDGYSRRARMEP